MAPPTDKWALLDQMVGLLSADGTVEHEAASIRAAVRAREEQLTTGLEAGVALPHGLLPPPVRPRGVLAVIPEGINFDSLDGRPAHFVLLMILGDDDEGRAAHLSTLATAVSFFSQENARQALLAAPDSAALYGAFTTGAKLP